MKSIRLVTAAVLTATILAGGVTNVFAAENRGAETDNTVTFTPNEEEVVINPPVIEPEIDPIDPVPPGQTGPLTLAYVSPTFDFGEQAITTQDRAYSMIAEEQTADGEPVPYVSFAQVVDTRGKHEGWTLSVDLTDFVSATSNDSLLGAQIEFVAPWVAYEGTDTDRTPSAATNNGESLFLNVGQDDVVVMSANDGQGAGRSSLVWGDQTDLNNQAESNADDEDVLNHGIRLHVPGSANPDAARYAATMTWSLSSVADNEGETTPED
ncbi:hypothetical protein IGJ74_000821 [Enterococcus sp. AZ009]|uniref:WxL domain-containing protein n=1 Tax=Enterococcus TaxID=1350 RepID=UPI001C484A7E|nr:WxL domain-containing protein [Enterococcus casseliflavus]